MPVQLVPIREYAGREGWRLVCEGRAEEETVVRFRLPSGTNTQVVSGYFNDGGMTRGNSVSYFYEGMELPASCDEERIRGGSLPIEDWPPEMRGPAESPPARLNPFILTAGLRTHIEPLGEIARSCGFAAALVRPFRGGDIDPVPEGVGTDTFVLSAEEYPSQRNGPLLCYVQLSGRYMIEAGLLP